MDKTVGNWRLLWPALALSGIGYLGLAIWFPLRPNLDHVPTADIFSLAHSLGNGLAYAGLLILLFVLLIVAVRGIWERGLWRDDAHRAPWQSLLLILAVATLFGLPLVLMYPVNATDLFRYAQEGRLSSIYAGNPFIEPLSDYPQDPLFRYAGEWANETTPYGPVWEGAAALTTGAFPDNFVGGLLAFKSLGLVLLLANSVLLWLLLEGLPASRRAAFVVLWAWNPALLLTFVANGHNDALMLFWLLLGMVAIRRGKSTLGLALIMMAALTKPIAVLALPIFLLAELRGQPTMRRKAQMLLMTGLSAIVLTGLAFLPWASRGGWAAAPIELVSRLTWEASAGAGFSPTVFFYFVLETLGLNESILAIGDVLMVAFILLYLGVMWQTWRGRAAASSVAATFIGYMVQALNFRIWYAVWPFPFLIQSAAARDDLNAPPMTYWLRAGFWFLLTSQLSVVIYSHIRVFLLDESHLEAHLIAVPFTFLVPLLLARWSWFSTG